MWQELCPELLQEESHTLARLDCMSPAVQVHCWLGQHNHRPLLQGSPRQQQDNQLKGNHQEHEAPLVRLSLKEHHLVVQVESWPMGELASVLEVLKVEDPVGAWVCEGHWGACGQCEGEGMEVLIWPQLLVESRGPRPDGKYPPKPRFRGP